MQRPVNPAAHWGGSTSYPWPLVAGLWVGVLLCFSTLSSAFAEVEKVEDVAALSLVDVVRHAIAEHPEIKMQRQAVRAAEARVEERAGAFDVHLSSSASHEHVDLSILTHEQPAYNDQGQVQSERTTWRVGAYKDFDFGMRLETYAEVERAEQVGLWPSSGRAKVAVVATQALLRGRGAESGAGAREKMAQMALSASQARLKHTSAQRILGAVTAYWGYVAAHERLAILTTSEGRAEALLAEVEMLISKDERPGADVLHFKSLVADRQAARTAAEVDVVRARQSLGLAMGLESDAIEGLPRPADLLPSPDAEWRFDAETRVALEDYGTSRRGDLAAALRDIEAAELLVRAAERDVDPRLDLQFSLGYTGLDEAEGAETLITPLGGTVGGPDVSVVLDFAWPIQNRALLGRLARERALLERARIAVKDLERTVRSEISALASSLMLEIRAHSAATVSVSLHQQSVDNQRRRLRSALTTAIDVLVTEERLTGALLGALASQYRYAQGVSRLRFATASLLPERGGLEALTQTHLSRPPSRGED